MLFFYEWYGKFLRTSGSSGKLEPEVYSVFTKYHPERQFQGLYPLVIFKKSIFECTYIQEYSLKISNRSDNQFRRYERISKNVSERSKVGGARAGVAAVSGSFYPFVLDLYCVWDPNIILQKIQFIPETYVEEFQVKNM